MSRPIKITGWGHGLYEDSGPTRKEIVGTYRLTQDNRGFRYVLAGGTALGVGKLTSAPAEADADLLDENVVTAAAIGDTLIKFTGGGTTTLTKDELVGGMYCVNDGTGEGQMRRITSNPPSTGTAIVISIDEPLRVATVVTTSQHSIFMNPYSKVIIHTTQDFFTTGVPQVLITASEYGWSQTKGWGVCWQETNTAAGSVLKPAATNGQAVIQDGYSEGNIGVNGPAVGVAAEYYPVFFYMDN